MLTRLFKRLFSNREFVKTEYVDKYEVYVLGTYNVGIGAIVKFTGTLEECENFMLMQENVNRLRIRRAGDGIIGLIM